MIIRMAPPGHDHPPPFPSPYILKDSSHKDSKDEVHQSEEGKPLSNGHQITYPESNDINAYFSSPEARNMLTIGRQIVEELQKLTQKLNDDAEEAELQDEWVFASIVQRLV